MNMPGTPLETHAKMGAPKTKDERGTSGVVQLAHSDIRDKMAGRCERRLLDGSKRVPVHDIHMKPFCAALYHALAFCSKLAKVGRED
jgi:hypothetical protein